MKGGVITIGNSGDPEKIAEAITKLSDEDNGIGAKFEAVAKAQDAKIGGSKYKKTKNDRDDYIKALDTLADAIDELGDDDELDLTNINNQLTDLGFGGVTINEEEIKEEKLKDLNDQLERAKDAFDRALEAFRGKSEAIDTILDEIKTVGIDGYKEKLVDLERAYVALKPDNPDIKLTEALTDYLKAKAKVKVKEKDIEQKQKYFNDLKDLYISFAATSEGDNPQDIYLYDKNEDGNDNNIKGKQSALVDSLIDEYNKDGDDGINNYIENIKEIEELKNIDNIDTKLDFLKKCVKKGDKVKVYDALSDIFMDMARDKKYDENEKSPYEDFDKAYAENARRTLEHISKCAECAKNKTTPDSVGITDDDVGKFRQTLDNGEFSDYVNHLERSRIVSNINYSNKNLTEEEEKAKVPACADASKGREWSKISKEYKDCVKNHNNSIEFDGIDDEYDNEGNRIITFKNGNSEFTITLNKDQAQKFDMLEFGKHVGKDVGLFAGFCSYISANPEIGIDVNDMNNVLTISENGKVLEDQTAKNKAILKNFSGPKFNAVLATTVTTAAVSSIVACVGANIAAQAAAQTAVGAIALTCLGQDMSQRVLNASLVTAVNSLNQGPAHSLV